MSEQESASIFDTYNFIVECSDVFLAWTTNGVRKARKLEKNSLKWNGVSSHLSILCEKGYLIRVKRYPLESEGQGRALYLYIPKLLWNKIRNDAKTLAVLQALPASAFPATVTDVNKFWDVHGVKGLPYRADPAELKRLVPDKEFDEGDYILVQAPTIPTARTEITKESEGRQSVANLKKALAALEEQNRELRERLEQDSDRNLWDGLPAIEWHTIKGTEDIARLARPGSTVMAAYVYTRDPFDLRLAGTCPARVELFKLGATKEEMLVTRDLFGLRPLKWQYDTYWMTPWFDPKKNERGVLNWQVFEEEDEHAPILDISFYAIAVAEPPMPPKKEQRLVDGTRYEVADVGFPDTKYAGRQFTVWTKRGPEPRFAIATWGRLGQFQYVVSTRTIDTENVEAYMLLPEER